MSVRPSVVHPSVTLQRFIMLAALGATTTGCFRKERTSYLTTKFKRKYVQIFSNAHAYRFFSIYYGPLKWIL